MIPDAKDGERIEPPPKELPKGEPKDLPTEDKPSNRAFSGGSQNRAALRAAALWFTFRVRLEERET